MFLWLYLDIISTFAPQRYISGVIVVSAVCFVVLLLDCSGLMTLFQSLYARCQNYYRGDGWAWKMGYVRDQEGEWEADVKRLRQSMGMAT